MARGSAKTKNTHPSTFVALLRGINVGGKNQLPMPTLAAMFSAEGCSEVRTYIQSGNVVFRASIDVAARLGPLISQRIAKGFGYQIPILLRSGRELAEVLQGNPFLGKSGIEESALHVMFLADQPTPQRLAGLDRARSAPDTFAVRGREVYLHCPNGFGRTKLTNGYFDARLATHSTCRNWRTTVTLSDLARAPLTSSRAT
jgi:uncharacterized protein (DUF1697 family)